ncbi:hypothetical protein [Actinophytocola sp.]|uniref:hypothetical protein n=1 Tax=Actinophytocola sp. TaxID=1872138 RepID=UPI002ED4BF0F
MSRFTLPDALAHKYTAVRGGDLVLLGTGKDDQDALFWVGRDEVRTVRLGERPDEDSYSEPSLLAHPDGGVVVVRDLEHAVHVAGPDGPVVPIPVSGADLLGGAPLILYGGAAVSDEARWHVVLSDGLLMADLRYAAPLSVDLAAGTARWESAPWALDPTEFPRDLGGLQDNDPRASISATLLHGGTLHVCSAGSLIRSMWAKGTDFFSCVRLTQDGRVGHRLHEESGWKQDTKKHGIDARFTADGAYAILRPVFRTGTWNGRPRILRLADGNLLTPEFPRGLASADILDHHPDRGWWLRLKDTVTVVPAL